MRTAVNVKTEASRNPRVTLQTPLPLHCECDRQSCRGEVVQIDTASAKEIYIRCDPTSIRMASGSPLQQARSFYGCLPRILNQAGASMNQVVLERVFFRDLHADFEAFSSVRREAYHAAGVSTESLPVASYVGQAPCEPGQALELQIYAVVSKSRKTGVITVPSTSRYPAAKVVQINGHRHLYVRGITGRDDDGQPLDSFRAQSDGMFAAAAQLLGHHGASFSQVLRTWCYLTDIDHDYEEFNASRNDFFSRQAIRRLPASTGIRAGLHPAGTKCAVDLYALLDPQCAEIKVMHTPTLNEAPEYGASFSRGMKVSLPEKTVLFISGTASVDESGSTAHVGSPEQQIERMLLNVQKLLAPHGATFGDLVQVISYLKSADNLQLFRETLTDWGLTDVPNSVVQADICRSGLLCEMEAIAVLPH